MNATAASPTLSVIMPVYERPELLLLSLACLARQTLDDSSFEVILVDDGSAAATIRQIESTAVARCLPLRVIHLHENVGRAGARNAGLESARGRLVVFLDADMLVRRDYLEQHLATHGEEENLVVTGPLHWRRIWTHVYHDLSGQQRAELHEALAVNRRVCLRYYGRLATQGPPTAGSPLALVGPDDLAATGPSFWDFTYVPSWSMPYTGVIYQAHGKTLEGYGMPWIAMVTGNCSVRRELLVEAGGFDSAFRGWGFEDYELGYRLSLLGTQFCCVPAVDAAHQNHPVDRAQRDLSLAQNYHVFLQKHPDLPVLLLALALDNWNLLHTLGLAVAGVSEAREAARGNASREAQVADLEARIQRLAWDYVDRQNGCCRPGVGPPTPAIGDAHCQATDTPARAALLHVLHLLSRTP